jgi:hypothetical protein
MVEVRHASTIDLLYLVGEDADGRNRRTSEPAAFLGGEPGRDYRRRGFGSAQDSYRKSGQGRYR